MKKAILFAVCLTFLPVFCPLCIANCTEGKRLYNLALHETNINLKISLLERSVQECGEFHSHYELGRAYMRTDRPDKAERAFRDAMGFPASDRETARLLADHGLLCRGLGREQEAVFYLTRSYDRHPYPVVLAALKEIEMERAEKGMDAGYIKKALGQKALFGVEPSLNMRIGFDFDSAVLDESGRNQVKALGKALSDEAFAGMTFTLIGHTDSRGAEAYNQGLSERRALAVKQYLVAHYFLDPPRIQTNGRGERDLLYPDDSEDAHALNRRVEVKVGREK